MKKILPIFIVVVLIVGGVCFFAGMKYGQSKNSFLKNFPNFDGAQSWQRQQTGTGFGRMSDRGGFISGEIISKDEKSITVKLPDGGSKIIFFSDTTTIAKSTDGSASDLENGKTVMVSGTSNSDGSVTAANIQIKPQTDFPRPENVN